MGGRQGREGVAQWPRRAGVGRQAHSAAPPHPRSGGRIEGPVFSLVMMKSADRPFVHNRMADSGTDIRGWPAGGGAECVHSLLHVTDRQRRGQPPPSPSRHAPERRPPPAPPPPPPPLPSPPPCPSVWGARGGARPGGGGGGPPPTRRPAA